jgi:very-short-patch-repair endonuclease
VVGFEITPRCKTQSAATASHRLVRRRLRLVQHALVIELDGDSHIGRAEHDLERQSYLESEGDRVLRFGNDDVLNDLDTVLNAILQACGIAKSSG